ncbi:hypothetical protein SESBI_20815 [Sesbania bispinosa]|nr:hypothetical protein SESBI_20815 [Sesbania bispinosa]
MADSNSSSPEEVRMHAVAPAKKRERMDGHVTHRSVEHETMALGCCGRNSCDGPATDSALVTLFSGWVCKALNEGFTAAKIEKLGFSGCRDSDLFFQLEEEGMVDWSENGQVACQVNLEKGKRIVASTVDLAGSEQVVSACACTKTDQLVLVLD